ncbi:MAG: metallophosphoesterase family protein, partial [Candidatus Woesearchaeota archaeon]|nr:metallophosphoesterase family protein [Candidatus Woesearchaeota archaeon]
MSDIWAVLSDVHGYAAPLDRALEEVRKSGVSRIYFLGDLTQGGREEAECLQLLKTHRVISVAGNHCRQSRTWGDVPAEVQTYLKSLDLVIQYEDSCFSHENPLKECVIRRGIEPFIKDGGIRTTEQAKYLFDKGMSEFSRTRLFFVGHTHDPAVWECDGRSVVKLPLTEAIQLEKNKRYI